MDNKPHFKNNVAARRLDHATIKFNVTKRYEELDEKFKARKMNAKEMKEYENLKKVIANLPKMDNVFKFQENLITYQKALVEELSIRKSTSERTEKIESYMDFLEDQLKDLKDKILDTNSKLKDPNISEEDKEKLEGALESYKKKLGNNQLEYSKVYSEQNKQEKTSKTLNEKFKDLSKEDLCTELEKSSIAISKCTLYLNKLLKGESIEDIKVQENATDWKKFIADRRQSEKLHNLKKAQKAPLSLQAQIGDFVNSVMPEQQPEVSVEPREETSENLPVEVSDFDKKHPTLARFKNWFKDKFSKISDKVSRKTHESKVEEPEEEQEQESGSSANPVENREEHKEETKQDKGSQFRESLKQQTIADYDISKIAELGQKAYEEELANNKSNTEKKLAAKRLADNRRKLYGDSAKNMNTSISDKLNDLSKSDDER